MWRLLLNRFLGTLLVITGVIVISFVITHLVPADPARVAAGLMATEEQVAALRVKMGLDQPLHVQFGRFATQLAHGDLGRSFITSRSVIQDLKLYLPATLELVIASTILFVGLGLLLGVLCAVTKKKWLRTIIKVFSVGGLGVPAFWLALMLQLIFYAKLDLLPPGGRIAAGLPPPTVTGFLLLDSLLAGNFKAFGSAASHLILPAATLAINRLGVTLRLVEVEVRKVLRQDYVRTARAKGLVETVVIYKHALRNALIPVVTMAGLQFGWLLGGTVLVETVFSWPGLGQYAVFSITSFDFMPVIGVTVLMALMFCVINLIVDLIYAVIDPRLEAR
jgi:peptide/nickel transport system permease protein